MAEMKSYLKEMDMAIIQRRLDARKRNITREDGKLSKRQLAMAYRGYHGLESRYHALLHMSNTAMMNTKVKNDHVNLKHVEDMKALFLTEKVTEVQADKEIHAMREDFRAQLAYSYVYKNHSFKKYDRLNTAKKPRPNSDKPEMYEQVRKMNEANVQRPLGSLRQIETYRNELQKIEFPPINDHGSEKKSKVNMMGDRTYEHLKDDPKGPMHKETAFPKIETAMGVEMKYRHKMNQDFPEKDSLYSAPAGFLEGAADRDSDKPPHAAGLDMGQNLMLMRKKEQERYERHRVLPIPPTGKDNGKNKGWRRVLPPTPSRPTSVFPGNTKNSIGMKKLLQREYTDVISKWRNSSKRIEKVEIYKEMDRMSQKSNPLPVFDSNRPTSAIIRDFEAYQKYKNDITHIQQQEEADQSIIIRQMSPQPRPESPISQSRSGYKRLSTPMSKQHPDTSLKRPDSEKIPSVSRTSSYKTIPDDHVHENALLTAAERIELEQRLRGSVRKRTEINEADQTVDKLDKASATPKQKTRRHLPQTPESNSKKISQKPKSKKSTKLKLEPMFKTAILARDREDSVIDKVKAANDVVIEIPDETQDGPHGSAISENSEINQYSPIAKRAGTPKVIKCEDISDQDKIGFMRELTDKRLSKGLRFNYDSYSRTTPDPKKHLEMRAKMRRKIQLQNANLDLQRKKRNESNSSTGPDRASSRVSFNENVIVFQTI